jgi:putative acetyltransferase
MTLTLRPEAPTDVAAIRAVNEAAFAGTEEADLVDALRSDGDLVLSLVAAEDDDVIGHIAFSRLRVESDGSMQPAVALAPVAVSPAHQCRGIGMALIEDGLRCLKQAGETLVFVLGEPRYYGRFGFAAVSAARFVSPYPGRQFQSLALSPRAPSSGTLNYAPAFSVLS